jgi:hypothetical protein
VGSESAASSQSYDLSIIDDLRRVHGNAKAIFKVLREPGVNFEMTVIQVNPEPRSEDHIRWYKDSGCGAKESGDRKEPMPLFEEAQKHGHKGHQGKSSPALG